MPPLPPPAGQDHVDSYPDFESSLPSAEWEIVAARNRDEKRYQKPDGEYVSVFRSNLHYEASPGAWEDVDLDFRPSGPDQVMDRSQVAVHVTGEGVSVTDRAGGQGIRWQTPVRPHVAGRLARLADQGLEWEYETIPSGVKLSGTVPVKRGPKVYEFGYQLIGKDSKDLRVGDTGDLVGEGFVVPKGTVVGADGSSYSPGSWRVLPGNRVAFDFDDTPLPLAAFPYVIDPTTMFGGFDSAVWVGDGPAYPPTDWKWGWWVGGTAYTFVGKDRFALASDSNSRTHCFSSSSPCYSVSAGMLRWDTSSLPDNASVKSASVLGPIGPVDNADNADLEFEFPGPWAPASPDDWEPNPGPPAGAPFYLTQLVPNATNNLGIHTPSAVSKTGYSELKMHIHGETAPTGYNGFSFGNSSNGVALIVNYCQASASSTYGNTVMADQPISYWSLDETSGAAACDMKDKNTGQIAGGVTLGQSAAVSGTAMGFNGSSGYIGLNGATSLQPTAGLTVEGWIKTTSTAVQTVMRSVYYGYDLYLVDGRPTAFACGQADPCAESITGSFAKKLQGAQSVADGRWHHLALTKDATTSTLYVDGARAAAVAHTEPIHYGGTGIAIGRDGDFDWAHASGSLDEVAVYGHALSADRIRAHAAAGPVVTAGTTQGGADNPSVNLCQNSVGDPVSTSNGNFWHTFADLSIPGRGPGLDLARTYNSSGAGTDGPFGWGWSSTYTMRADTDVAGIVTVTQENGSQVTFTPTATGGYTAPTWVLATLVKNADGSLTLTRRSREIFTFSPTGPLTAVKDLNGYVTAVATNASGRPTTVTDSAGRVLTFTYGANGRVSRVADPTGRDVTYTYDGAGNLASVTDVTDGLTTFTSDAAHRVLTMTMPRRLGAYTNHYDSLGRVDSQTDPLGRVTTLDYTSVPGSTKVISPANRTVTLDTYRNGQLVSQTEGYGTAQAATTTRAYDPVTLGCTSVTDPNNHTTTMTYDARGNRLTSKDALLRETKFTYDAMNNVTSVRDAKLVTTTMTYDAKGNLVTSARPLLNDAGTATVATQTVTYNYGENGNPNAGDVTSVVDPIGQRWTYAYDGNGYLSSVIDPQGRQSTAVHDTLGRKTSSVSARGWVLLSNPGGYTTSYTYDADGLLTRVTDPLGKATVSEYDANRNLKSTTDANQKKTTYIYDAADQLTDVRRHDNTNLHNEYFPDGRLQLQRDGAGADTAYTYDSLGRLATVTDPAGRSTTYSHDPGGNMVSKQDPGGNCGAVPKVGCASLGFDVADQLTTITYSDGATPNVTMGYDANGRRTSMTDGTGNSSWTHDSLGRLVAATTGSALPGGAKTVRHGYDLRNSVTSVSYPGNLALSRVYHPGGRLSSQTDWTGAGMIFNYDADDNLTARNVPGTDSSFAYDQAGGMTNIWVNTLILLGVGSLGYTRDDAGQVTSSVGNGPTTESNNYTYNGLNQLKTVNGASYNYDAADNLTRLTDGTTQAFSAANQLCWSAPSAGSGCGTPPAGATTYGYDTRGNRTSRTPPAGAAAAYGYDQANRLTSAPGATYRYRGDGLRLAKTVGGVTTTFAWDESGPLPLLLSETTNGATTRYIYDDKGTPLEQLGTDGVGSYLHHDQLGSVRMITQNGANVMGTFTYDAYGKKTATTGTVTTPFGFAGEYTDAETGIVYLRARYYDPATGQFLSRDPIEALTREPYGYVGGNPLNLIDPTGLCKKHGGFFGAARDAACEIGEGDGGEALAAAGRTGKAALDNRVVRAVGTGLTIGIVCGATGTLGCVLLVGGMTGGVLGGFNAVVNDKCGGVSGGFAVGVADGLKVGATRAILGQVFQGYGNVGWMGVPRTVGGSITIAGLRTRLFR